MKQALLVMLVFILVACSPSEASIQTAIAQTQAAIPGSALIPIPTNAPTINITLTSDKIAGVWLVGSEIAVGQWRASGDCTAIARSKEGDALAFADGNRAIISLVSYTYTVEFLNYPGSCTWSYLGN